MDNSRIGPNYDPLPFLQENGRRRYEERKEAEEKKHMDQEPPHPAAAEQQEMDPHSYANCRAKHRAKKAAEKERLQHLVRQNLEPAIREFDEENQQGQERVRHNIDAHIQHGREKVDEVVQLSREQLEEARARYERLQQEIQKYQRKIDELKQNVDSNGNQINQAQQEQRQLEIALLQAKKEQKEKEAQRLKIALIAAGVVVGCGIGTMILQSAGAASGSSISAALIPKDGGALFAIKVPFP